MRNSTKKTVLILLITFLSALSALLITPESTQAATALSNVAPQNQSSASVAPPAAPSAPDKIEDNSFLIEEAYNQEAGVVQHIQTFQSLNNGTFAYSFTEEVPIPREEHQLSVTVPALRPNRDLSGGVGDILLNYRYGVSTEGFLKFTPRLTAVLPTGRWQDGYGAGSLAPQINLPLTWEMNRWFVTHYNLGATLYPARKATNGVTATAFSFNYGTSLIWLAHRRFNVMAELYALNDDVALEDGTRSRVRSVYFNPGFRGAIDIGSLQVVPGLAFPIGLGESSGQYGVFAYLSLEHPLF